MKVPWSRKMSCSYSRMVDGCRKKENMIQVYQLWKPYPKQANSYLSVPFLGANEMWHCQHYTWSAASCGPDTVFVFGSKENQSSLSKHYWGYLMLAKNRGLCSVVFFLYYDVNGIVIFLWSRRNDRMVLFLRNKTWYQLLDTVTYLVIWSSYAAVLIAQ
jgi:hypothetical protein